MPRLKLPCDHFGKNRYILVMAMHKCNGSVLEGMGIRGFGRLMLISQACVTSDRTVAAIKMGLLDL